MHLRTMTGSGRPSWLRFLSVATDRGTPKMGGWVSEAERNIFNLLFYRPCHYEGQSNPVLFFTPSVIKNC